MGGKDAHRAQEQVANVVACPRAEIHHIAVLKCVVSDIHLVGAEHHAKADFVLATDQVEVSERVDVGPP